jgi:hypothetical protein
MPPIQIKITLFPASGWANVTCAMNSEIMNANMLRVCIGLEDLGYKVTEV